MSRQETKVPSDPLPRFETDLRAANERIVPSDDQYARLESRLADLDHSADRYVLTIHRASPWRPARRLVLPMAALLAISAVASLFFLSRPRPSSSPPQQVTRSQSGPHDAPLDRTADIPTSVVMTGDKPTIVRELPTERPDVTIVWIYDAPRSNRTTDSSGEPVGAAPTPQTNSTGTHS